MLVISGLLTLLVISHAEGAGIKGGLHIKSGALNQEQVAQEDIPAPYSIKTGPVFGTKVTSGDADGSIKSVMSKKAPAPTLHHSVKTAVDRTSKTHPVPGLHHAATSPVAQDQVLIDVSGADTSGIKTIKTTASGKTRFSQSDSQVRDPVTRPVVQTIKTVQEPATESSQGVKTLKTIDTGKTRFSEQDKQQRDPIARPIIQTLQSTVDSPSDSTKTLKTVTRGKTRFSQGDTQVRDPVAGSVIQTVKTDKDSSAIQQTVKTSIKTEPSDIRRKTVKSSQKSIESASASSVPASIVESARRNTLRISVPDSQLAGIQEISAGNYAAGLRSEGNTGIRQSTSIGNQETVFFNGKEISVGGLQAGQLFDENLQPILSDNAAISGQANIRASPVPQIPQPVRSSGVTQTAGVSTFTSSTGSLTRTTSGATRRRQQTVNNPGERVQLRAPARQPIASVVQTGTSGAGLRSQGAAGIRQSTTAGSQETVFFNGKEISVGGLQAGQLFDENLQPILSGNEAISGQANSRASPVPQIPQVVRSTGLTQTSGVSTLTSSTGSQTRTTSGATRRRQQAVTVPRERVQLRTPARQPIASVVQTGTSGARLRSQGATGIRQSSTGSQETVYFNGKEISVGGLQAGQLFDENLQPILSGNAAIFGQSNIRASPVPQIPQPARSPGVTQTAGVSTLTSSTGSLTRTTSGVSRRRQQAVTVPRERVQLRTPARQPIASVVQTGTSGAGLRSQGAAGIQQSSIAGSQETVFFNGKEISVGGLQAGQLFDENLQPILSGSAAISGQANVRASPVPQIPQPVRSAGVSQTAGVSTFTSSTGSLTRTTSGATRRRQQAVTVPRERVQLRTPARQPIASVIQTGTSGAGLRSQGAAGIRQSSIAGSQETVFFNGKEISVGGLQAGQLFDENLQPILSGNAAISGQGNIRSSPVPQITQPIRSPGVTQTAGVSTLTSSTGSLTRTTSGISGRREQTVNVPRERAQLRTPARQPIASVVQTGTSGFGLRSQGAAGIRQSTTTGSQETVFNGKEISVGGLQAGQLFDENLQPILSDNAAGFGQADVRASPVPPIPQTVRSSGVTQTAGISTLTSGTGSLTRTTSGATRRRQQAVNVPRQKVELRTPARQPIASFAQTGTSGAGLRSQGAAGFRQSTTTGRKETVLFNGKEISVGGLQAGQLFDENLQPILSGNTGISGQVNARASPVPQIPQPVRSTGVTQTAGVSTYTSSTGSLTRTTSGATRRRQQAVNVPRQKVELRTPARQPIASVVQTGTSGFGLRSQGAAGIRQSTTAGSKETVSFNGKEISVGGLQAGQLFDENLQPILSDNAAISGQANVRASPVPQIPQLVRSTGVTQTAGVSTLTSSTGSLMRTTSGATRRRQQAVNVPREKVQLRTPARQPIASVVQTGTYGAGLRSQGAAGIRQSTTTGSQETVFFNGKEISVGGLQAGQLFDENLQPILSGNAAISGQANVRASPVPQIPQPIRSQGVTQTAGVSTLTSNSGTFTRTSSGATRRRQQAVNVPGERVQLRTPARQPIASVTQSGTSGAGLRSQGATGIQQSTTTGRQETVLFNGKEISVGGLQVGQLFDENLQPILSDNAAISGQANVRASPVPQIPQPVRSSGVTQTAGVSRLTSNSGTLTRTSSGATRRRQQAVNVPGERVQLRTPARQPIASVVQTGTSGAGLRSQGAAGIRQSTSAGSQETVFFNGKEISVGGLQAGQLFDENLQPILSGNAAISGQANVRASPVPQIPQPVRSAGVSQTAGVSTFTSSTGSLTRTTSGATRRRQQAVTVPRERVQLRTPARQPIASVMQTGTSGTGFQVNRQSTTTGSQETVFFNGKEINVGGLQAGQLFDENLQPIRSSSISQDIRPIVSSGVRQTSTNLRNTGVSSTALDTSVSRGSEFGLLDSISLTDESLSSQGGSLSRGSGLQASGLPRRQYSSRNPGQSSSLSGILNTRTISNTEFSQDRVETPVIQEKQDIPVVPQLKVEDIVEQTSYTNPAALKSAQVQETIPFTIPRTPSKPLFTKISQLSQKDIDIPTVQQQVVTGDFSGYLPKASFLPPFNYGVPVSSKYTVKAPIVQEQQKVEQEFV